MPEVLKNGVQDFIVFLIVLSRPWLHFGSILELKWPPAMQKSSILGYFWRPKMLVKKAPPFMYLLEQRGGFLNRNRPDLKNTIFRRFRALVCIIFRLLSSQISQSRFDRNLRDHWAIWKKNKPPKQYYNEFLVFCTHFPPLKCIRNAIKYHNKCIFGTVKSKKNLDIQSIFLSITRGE